MGKTFPALLLRRNTESMAIFNKDRAHGIIFGIPGAAFEQDGKMFSATGEQVGTKQVERIISQEPIVDENRVATETATQTITLKPLSEMNIDEVREELNMYIEFPAAQNTTEKKLRSWLATERDKAS